MILDLSLLFSLDSNEITFDELVDFSDEVLMGGAVFPTVGTVKGSVHRDSGLLVMEYVVSIDFLSTCDRCLKKVEEHLSKTFRHNIVRKLSEEDDGTFIVCAEKTLDLDDLVFSDLLLDLPIKVLCKDTCMGLCELCGQNKNEGTCSCEKVEIDPRLAVLKDFLE